MRRASSSAHADRPVHARSIMILAEEGESARRLEGKRCGHIVRVVRLNRVAAGTGRCRLRVAARRQRMDREVSVEGHTLSWGHDHAGRGERERAARAGRAEVNVTIVVGPAPVDVTALRATVQRWTGGDGGPGVDSTFVSSRASVLQSVFARAAVRPGRAAHRLLADRNRCARREGAASRREDDGQRLAGRTKPRRRPGRKQSKTVEHGPNTRRAHSRFSETGECDV
jgi:hypothetical protein